MGTKNFARLLFVTAVCLVASACTSASGPFILSSYESTIGANQLRRDASHAGVDFGEMYGAPVLAAADGVVLSVSGGGSAGCGNGVLIAHQRFYRYTVYCHLQEARVRSGQEVRRGEIIGLVGTSGAASGVPHVHFELCTYPCTRGHMSANRLVTEDPLAFTVGCFDPQKEYPTDRLALNYPIRCKDRL